MAVSTEPGCEEYTEDCSTMIPLSIDGYRPDGTPIDQWDELLQRPGQMDWNLYIYVYYPLYQLSTVILVASVIAQFSPRTWLHGFWDYFIFTVPSVLVPMMLNIWAKHSWSFVVGNKIWMAFLTVLSVIWNMLYVIFRNIWDWREWNMRDQTEKDKLRARLSAVFKLGGTSKLSIGNAVESGAAPPAKRVWFSRLAREPDSSSKDHMSASKKPEIRPTETKRLLWLFAATSYLSVLYFMGQRLFWIRVKFSERFHKYVMGLTVHINSRINNIILGPQHQSTSPTSTVYATEAPSSKSSSLSSLDGDSHVYNDGITLPDDEEAGGGGGGGPSISLSSAFPPPPSVPRGGVLRTAVESPMFRTAPSSASAAAAAAATDLSGSISMSDFQQPPTTTAAPPTLTRQQTTAPIPASERFSYREYLFAQSVYEGNQ
ncbi:hypothetical protein HDU86_005976, partial [Geranomyces michiganensis]